MPRVTLTDDATEATAYSCVQATGRCGVNWGISTPNVRFGGALNAGFYKYTHNRNIIIIIYTVNVK